MPDMTSTGKALVFATAGAVIALIASAQGPGNSGANAAWVVCILTGSLGLVLWAWDHGDTDHEQPYERTDTDRRILRRIADAQSWKDEGISEHALIQTYEYALEEIAVMISDDTTPMPPERPAL